MNRTTLPAGDPGDPGRPASTRLVLVRHGETGWNHLRRIQGQTDIALNEVGIRQARAAAVRLAGEPVAAVYASDLSRAWRTAELIAEPLGLPVLAEPRLRERHWGRFEGTRFVDIERDAPHDHARLLARDTGFDLGGGESLDVLMQRVAAVLAELAERHRDQTIVAVSHGGVLDCAHRIASGLALAAPRDFPLHNASVNVLRRDGGRFTIERWGDIDHLADAADEIDPRRRPGPTNRPEGQVG